MVCEKGEVPTHFHQIGQYIIFPLNFSVLKDDVIKFSDKETNGRIATEDEIKANLSESDSEHKEIEQNQIASEK